LRGIAIVAEGGRDITLPFIVPLVAVADHLRYWKRATPQPYPSLTLGVTLNATLLVTLNRTGPLCYRVM